MDQLSIALSKPAWVWWQYVFRLIIIGIIYVATGLFSGQILSLSPQLPIVWLPSGIMLAIVMIGGYRYLVGVAIGVCCLALLRDQSLFVTGAVALSNMLTIGIGVYLLKTVYVIDMELKRIRDVILLVLLGGFGVMLLGSITVTLIMMVAYPATEISQQFLTLWIGSSLSVIFITPLILTWYSDRTFTDSWHTWLESIGLIVFSVLLGWVSYSNILQLHTIMPTFYLMLPPIIWAMVRFRLREVTLVNAITIGFLLWSAQIPDSLISDMLINDRILHIWSTIAIGSVVSLLVKMLIDERHTIEKTLKTERDFTSQILETLGQGITIISKTGQYEYVNAAFANLLSMDAKDLIGRTPYDFATDNFKRELDAIFQVREKGDPSTYRATLKNPEDEEITVLVTGVPRYVDKAHVGSVSVVTDIRPLLEAEQARIKSEAFLRAVFENSADGIVVLDQSGKIAMANRAHQNLVGYTADELSQMTVRDYVSPDDYERAESLFNLALQNNEDSYQLELRYIRNDKTIRWVDATVGLIRDKDGNHQHTVVVSRDITESRKIKQTVENSEKRFRAIFENASLPIAVTREDRIIGTVNRAFCDMLGYTEDELQQMRFDDITYSDDTEENVIKYQQLISEEIDHFSLIKRYIHQDGSIVWANLSVSRFEGNIADEDEANLYTIAIIENITERKLAEQELQRSEALFRVVFENSADGINVVNTASRIMMSNRAHQNLVGYSAVLLSTMTVRDYVHPDDIDQEEALFQHALKYHEDSYQLELRIIRSDKTIRWIAASVGMIWDTEGHYQYAVAISHDITEARNIKQAIENSEKRFRAIFENASLPISITRKNRVLGMVNRAFSEMLGYSITELLQMKFDDYTYQDDKREDLIKYRQLMNEDIDEYTLIKRYIHRNGSIIWVNISVSRFMGSIKSEDGENLYSIAIIENITERKRAEQALKESEEQYRSIFENSLVGIYRSAVDGRFLSVNPAIVEMLGYSTEEDLYNLDVQQNLYVTSTERHSQKRQQTYLISSVIEDQTRLKKKNGDTIIVSVRAKIIRDDDGNIQYLEGTMIDITDRKLAEDRLNAEMHLNEQLIDALPGVFYLLDEGGYLLRWNKQLKIVSGFTDEEMESIQAHDFFPPKYHATVDQTIQQVFDEGSSVQEALLMHRDGHVTPHLMSGYRIMLDDQVCLVGVGTDISNLKVTEAALRESEARYRSLFENSPVGIGRSTLDGRFLSVNPAMVEIYGYDSAEELYKLDLAEDVYVDSEERTSPDRLHTYRTSDVIEYEARQKKKNGDIIIVSVKAKPIRDDDGNIQYFEGSLTDITEQHRQAEEIKQLNEDLERRVKERTEQLALANEQLLELDRLRAKFIADISHEMRTPLAVLNTRLYLLQYSKNEDGLERHIQGFRTQLDRLEEFVENAFEISLIDMSRDTVAFEKISLNIITEDVIKALAPRAEVVGLGLSYQLDLTLPRIMGVENHLSQVATNLIGNAIKYTGAGQIQITTGKNSITNRVYLRVEDTGMGIAEEDIPHLFSRFYRGQRAGQSTISGSGLGLSIVKEIVDAHNGHIDVESEINNGSAFTVWLPIEPESYANTHSTHDDATTTLDEK